MKNINEQIKMNEKSMNKTKSNVLFNELILVNIINDRKGIEHICREKCIEHVLPKKKVG
jgi:hypothetical protein